MKIMTCPRCQYKLVRAIRDLRVFYGCFGFMGCGFELELIKGGKYD